MPADHRIYFHGAGEGHKMDAITACGTIYVQVDNDPWIAFEKVEE